ncbi:T7SS effector LXG polymorphic toxin [Gracilibacillus kekensis]|uniref:DNase/tRNase domain of colicin-like bacteriocin n=1 Tax=Gracilibacillus kekensis TaxID=1027249 RepID=A0A1M7K0T8_9BACI|nr:T7SS effector LXG polymorphic toxin [Gracilibacillus kekensis]SHM58791.1 DNase/tRNase domain of colicin-like bacteriocin [Gracilibacillus kekensis]
MSNQRVHIEEVSNFYQEVRRQTASITAVLQNVQDNIDQLIHMERFQGEAADAAIIYFEELHQTLLQAFTGVFEQLETNITRHLQEFDSEVDGSSQAIIHTAYLDSEEEDIQDTYRQLEDVQRDVKRIIGSVSDLTTAHPPPTSNVADKKEESTRVMRKLSRKVEAYSQSFSRDNLQMESALQEIKSLMGKVTNNAGKKEMDNSIQAQLPFIKSLVAEAKEQSAFSRMLWSQEDRDRQTILALRNQRNDRETIGLQKYVETTVAQRQLAERIQYFFQAHLQQNFLHANRWWRQTVTNQVDVTKKYLLNAGSVSYDYLMNLGRMERTFYNDVIAGPAEKSWESFKTIGNSAVDSVSNSLTELNEKKWDSFYDFANYLTIGIPDAVIGFGEGLDQRREAFQNDPTTSNFFNYATMGTSDMAVNAVNPEEAFSPEHWLNSFGTATVLFTGGASSTSSHLVTKTNFSIPKPPVTVPKVTEPWTFNNALEWLKDPFPEVYIVQDSFGGNQFVFSWRGSGREGYGSEHKGKLKGKEVLLKDIKEKEITYTKRDRQEFKQLRNRFNSSVRKSFLQILSMDEKNSKQLIEAGLTKTDMENLKKGFVPDGYQVHHKLPLDDGGTNDFENLILIKNDPYHKVLTNSQKNLTKGLKVGESIEVNWPLPDGFIYPTYKK